MQLLSTRPRRAQTQQRRHVSFKRWQDSKQRMECTVGMVNSITRRRHATMEILKMAMDVQPSVKSRHFIAALVVVKRVDHCVQYAVTAKSLAGRLVMMGTKKVAMDAVGSALLKQTTCVFSQRLNRYHLLNLEKARANGRHSRSGPRNKTYPTLFSATHVTCSLQNAILQS